MPELSVIVPVYKVERYLPRCIESILNQTYKDFELILINDGSPDRCGEICNEYAKKDSRIVVIHQENKGVSAARNAGLRTAGGKYISFVDSDDFLELGMYEKMVSIARERDLDIVICGVKYCDQMGNVIREDLVRNQFYDQKKLLFDFFAIPSLVGGGCCNKLLKRATIEKIWFEEELAFSEDWVYLLEAFIRCSSAYQTPETFYNIVEREDSATRKEKIVAMYKIILGYENLLKKSRAHSKDLEILATNKFLDSGLRYINLMKEYIENERCNLKKMKLHIKWLMVKTLIRAKWLRLLSDSVWNGYFVGTLKM